MSDAALLRCVVLGRIGAAYGIKGWFHLHPFADDPESWLEMPTWWVSAKEPDAQGVAPWQTVTPEELRAHGNGLVARLTETPDRNSAEAVRGYWIGAPREALPVPTENEFYWDDLIGLHVFNKQGEALGIVERLLETGANTVLVVVDRSTESSAKAPERLIPFVREIVHEVDHAAGRMQVDWALDW